MKKIEAILLMIAVIVGIFLPIGMMVFGLGSLLFTKPNTFLIIAVYVAGVTAIGYVIFLLLKHPRTAVATKFIIGVIVVIALVGKCSMYSGSSTGCVPSRFIDCN